MSAEQYLQWCVILTGLHCVDMAVLADLHELHTAKQSTMPSFPLHYRKKQSFVSHKAALIFHFLGPQPDTSLHCQTMDYYYYSIIQCAHLHPSFHWHSLHLPM